MPNNSSAAVALLEHNWATHLSEAIRRAHGRILDSGLVSADEVEALGIELAAQQPTQQTTVHSSQVTVGSTKQRSRL
jgi:hypothetical protein